MHVKSGLVKHDFLASEFNKLVSQEENYTIKIALIFTIKTLMGFFRKI